MGHHSIIIDSKLSSLQAIQQNPQSTCPEEVLAKQVLFDVEYVSFDRRVHRGQVVAHKDLAEDIKEAFCLLLKEDFPIQSVIPIADKKFEWDDLTSCKVNNSSAFNYRFVWNTHRLSNHSTGKAIDINPFLNPYFPKNSIQPQGEATYNPSIPGTILANSSLVAFLKGRGWEWGGDWEDGVDYQHFQKLI